LDVLRLEGLAEKGIVEEVDLPDREVVGGAPVGIHPVEGKGGLRLMGGLRFGNRHGSSRIFRTVRAITISWSVGMTRTKMPLGLFDITAACVSFDGSSRATFRDCRRLQISRRMTAERSPIPPLKTSVSSPPRAAVKAPIHFATW